MRHIHKLALLVFLSALVAATAFAQGRPGPDNFPIAGFSQAGAPAGICPGLHTLDINTLNGDLYDCPVAGGAWVKIGSGGFGTGTVTQVNTGRGLTGGPITTTGTVSLLTALPNGQTATTQTTGDNTTDVATDAFVLANIASSAFPYPGAGIPVSTGTAWDTSLSETDGDLIAGISGAWTKTTALPNGTTATTQSPGDTSTDVATDAFVVAEVVNTGITGSGTANQVAKFTGTQTVGNSQVTDDGTHPVLSPNGFDVYTAGAYTIERANDNVTGTTNGYLACPTSTGTAIICPAVTSTTNKPFGCVISGGGTTGNAIIAQLGFASCIVSNSATAQHYAIEDPVTDGELLDNGTAVVGGQPNFVIDTANAGPGTASQIRTLISDIFIQGGGGFSNCMTTLGDMISGGLAGICARLAGPTSPNGVPQVLTSTPSGGAATPPVWNVLGVPVDAFNPATLLATDRTSYLNWTSGSTLTLPAIAGAFANNLNFVIKNTSGGAVALTPTSPNNIDGGSSQAPTSLPNNYTAFVYSDIVGPNWYTILLPTSTAVTGGTVTSFSAGTLSPLFTTSVANNTTTPALSFSLSNAAAFTSFGNFTSSSGAPSYTSFTAHIVSNPLECAAASGSGSTYTCTTAPTFTPAQGDHVLFKADLANTGAATLNVNSTAAKGINKQGGGTALAANDLLAGQWTVLIFDGTNWDMQGQSGNAPGTGTVTSIGTTSPITGGTITTTGTIACATCVTSAASLTSTYIMTGAGSQASQTPSSAATVDSSGNLNATTLISAGIVDGKAPVTLTTGASCTLGTASGCNSTKYLSGYTINQEATAATAITYTLPTAAAGLQYCVKNGNNGSAADTGTLEILTSAAGQFIDVNGTLSATGGYVISGGAAGDAACVVGIDSTHWEFYAQVGAWAIH